MKKIITLTTILLCSLVAFAETKENRKENPHEIRIGVADCFYSWLSNNDFFYGTLPESLSQGYVDISGEIMILSTLDFYSPNINTV